MILVLSNLKDKSTFDVIQWILSKNEEVVRLNFDMNNWRLKSICLATPSVIVEYNNKEIDLAQCSAVWYRRDPYSDNVFQYSDSNEDYNVLDSQSGYYIGQINNEKRRLIDFLNFFLREKCFSLGTFNRWGVNKLIILEMARQSGFIIPETFIATSKVDISKKIAMGKELITKAIDNGVYLITDTHGYYSYTKEVKENDVRGYADRFFPSMLQSKVNKKFELRIFYLAGRFYPMAIISNIINSVDYRKHKISRVKNRYVPYKLPDEITSNLLKLIDKLSLDSCSIDLMVDTNGQYVFLEVNPVGQFAMTSTPCNYYLEQKVANFLVNN